MPRRTLFAPAQDSILDEDELRSRIKVTKCCEFIFQVECYSTELVLGQMVRFMSGFCILVAKLKSFSLGHLGLLWRTWGSVGNRHLVDAYFQLGMLV